MTKLLSGNEALALGAYHAGVEVATAYPGTPSTEILETIAQFRDIYAEWSTNEKVAVEVAMGASYAGARSLVSMKHVGLNVASDPFMAASMTGVGGGLVVITADDPGIHSSQNEQDNRHYARLAKVPMLEPSDSQEAYDFVTRAFEISESFDTPVMLRSTTRISHTRSVVKPNVNGREVTREGGFSYQPEKYVMVPAYARNRHSIIEERLAKLALYADECTLNQAILLSHSLGIVTSGITYQYAREVFPRASFLKLGMVYPLPEKLIRNFATYVKKLVVIEELDSFLEDNIRAMGIRVRGKDFIPRTGELNPDIIEDRARTFGLLGKTPFKKKPEGGPALPTRNPRLCPGCPHTGLLFVLGSIGRRINAVKGEKTVEHDLIITGDIGCYTLGVYPPLNTMDTCACMGASIGQAIGIAKTHYAGRVVAIIGDSTFLHSGVTPLIDAYYNKADITVVILDNRTTAMTGHQEHPGTGVTAQGERTETVWLERLVHGIGIDRVSVVDAFNIKKLKSTLKVSLSNPGLSVIVVRGACSVRLPKPAEAISVDTERCNQCGLCLALGCPALQRRDGRIFIDVALCAGDNCALCQQICPRRAIVPDVKLSSEEL